MASSVSLTASFIVAGLRGIVALFVGAMAILVSYLRQNHTFGFARCRCFSINNYRLTLSTARYQYVRVSQPSSPFF